MKKWFTDIIVNPEFSLDNERELAKIEKSYPWFVMPKFIRMGWSVGKPRAKLQRQLSLNLFANNHYYLYNGGVKLALERDYCFVDAKSVEKNDMGEVVTLDGAIVIHDGKLNRDAIFPKGKIVITPSGLFYSDESEGYKVIREIIAVNKKSDEFGKKVNTDRTAEIIDVFLNKKITRNKIEDVDIQVSNVDLSAREVDEITTEAMAKIYISQGRKEEAIIIYNKLCLKYPEKSSYFANLISSLEDDVESV